MVLVGDPAQLPPTVISQQAIEVCVFSTDSREKKPRKVAAKLLILLRELQLGAVDLIRFHNV